MLARVGLHDEVGVGGFSVDCRCYSAVWEASDVAVEKGDLIFFFVLDGKLYALVYFVEASEVVVDDFHAVRSGDSEFCQDIVDIFFEK